MSVDVVWPTGAMALLTPLEADKISHSSRGELYELYRNCSLAVLNSGSLTDNSKKMLEHFEDFEISVVRNERGLKIELLNPPRNSLVDGNIIQSLRNHLYAVLRDLIQINVFREMSALDPAISHLSESERASHFVFSILRNAGCLKPGVAPNIAVCWGGHAVSQEEYDYAYKVGHELGLRGIDICTGCGPGIMEAPMRGAIMGHVLQCTTGAWRFIGLTEPSIIAAEPPNSLVSELVILPDIEKRLEAFVRLGHCMIIFPGGPGTAEELLFILAIKMSRENRHTPLPLILTGNAAAADYFEALERFLLTCLGPEVSRYYKKIIDDPRAVATTVKSELETVLGHRSLTHDSYCYNWGLHIPAALQRPFEATHENMAALNLRRNQDPAELATQLRAAFSGVVAGNVKEAGINQVAAHGPFKLHGEKEIIGGMGRLLQDFVAQGRFQLSSEKYVPCYELEAD